MSTLRLRILKRHTSLEVDIDTFYETELRKRDGRPDLDLSVFDIDADCLIQAHAEFAVSHMNPPIKTRGGISLDGCDVESRSTPGSTLFVYTQTRHVELRFLSEEELRHVAEQVHRERVDRRCSTDAAAVMGYGGRRLQMQDAEWVRACGERPKWKTKLDVAK